MSKYPLEELDQLLRESCDAIYMNSSVGCCWHIVLDDFNMDRASFEFCHQWAIRKGCKECMHFGELAEQATVEQVAKARCGEAVLCQRHQSWWYSEDCPYCEEEAREGGFEPPTA